MAWPKRWSDGDFAALSFLLNLINTPSVSVIIASVFCPSVSRWGTQSGRHAFKRIMYCNLNYAMSPSSSSSSSTTPSPERTEFLLLLRLLLLFTTINPRLIIKKGHSPRITLTINLLLTKNPPTSTVTLVAFQGTTHSFLLRRLWWKADHHPVRQGHRHSAESKWNRYN